MLPIVPYAWIPSGFGSLIFAFFCAQSRMLRSPAIASSRALIDFSRPTKSGTTSCGKTMSSRSGRSGILRTMVVYSPARGQRGGHET
jgi:hypothetical protein